MNRLTNSDLISASYSPWELCGLDKDCLRSCEECNIVEMYKKLAAYEDIGLKPEELQEIVDKQKWHVVADGDLPPKRPKRGFLHLYIVTYNYEDDPMITPRTGLAWYDCKGEWIGYNEEIDDFESGDVLAWRELPEPWEGEK
ncbi:hypothetical protein [Eubacterium callanderi]|uniref:hypothetical protein n=1 Tax=Eubacterium callanderi TaxID=53442 RepID=UPI001C113FA2|nr:hypothetical protein [Eubacterium callanderi]MBU5306040.1 hypothetical protein [Eubacterium callanderi]